MTVSLSWGSLLWIVLIVRSCVSAPKKPATSPRDPQCRRSVE